MYKEITECRCCKSANLYLFLELGDQPLANYYHDNTQDLDVYPLAVNVCMECKHVQLNIVVDPTVLYAHYLYASGDNEGLKQYSTQFVEFVEKIGKGVWRNDALRVLDIACNDGTQLNAFREGGWLTYGVDPAANLTVLVDPAHTVVTDFWNERAIQEFATHPTNPVESFDLIVAQNVFAHTDDVDTFLQNCKRVMHKNSVLMIQTSQANMILNNEFDTIYHEHLSFFNTHSMGQLVERNGLFLRRVEKTSIHGTSYVFIITTNNRLFSYNVGKVWEEEFEAGLYDLQTYVKFAANAMSIIDNLHAVYETYQNTHMLVGYGAAAKGMTVLNAAQLELDIIIDDSPWKQGLYTPGMNIPISSARFLDDLLPDANVVFVPLAWNFYDQIRQKIKKVRNNKDDLFVKYFPQISVSS